MGARGRGRGRPWPRHGHRIAHDILAGMDPRPQRTPTARARTVVAVACAAALSAWALAGHAPRPAVARAPGQAPGQTLAPSPPPPGPGRSTFGDALAGLVNTLRAERGVAVLPRERALDRAASAQAAALALAGGVAGDDTPSGGEALRAAVVLAGWDAPPDLTAARAYAVRRNLEQAADWLASPDNPDGAALFDAAATALGAATEPLADGRVAWVVVVAAGAPPPPSAGDGSQTSTIAMPGGVSDPLAPAVRTEAPPFAVTALPAARGDAFGPALPDTGALSGVDPLAAWTPALQRTARIVIAVVIGLFVVTALRLRGADPNG